MFDYKEIADFKQHIRDFLVQTKAFASQDNTALFADEQAQLKEASYYQDRRASEPSYLVCQCIVPAFAIKQDSGVFSLEETGMWLYYMSSSLPRVISQDSCPFNGKSNAKRHRKGG